MLTQQETGPIRVALVEDNKEMRKGLGLLINASPGLACIAQCATAEEALATIPGIRPDVVLMDIGLPTMSGIECIQRLKGLIPGMQIMMLTVFEDDEKIFKSLTAGASGYLLKNTPPDKLLGAIKDLHRGGSPMSHQIARRVVQAFQQPVGHSPDVDKLSHREQEILNLLTGGYLYKEIATQLGISIETVRTHIRHIYEKLHVRSRAQATLKIGGRQLAR